MSNDCKLINWFLGFTGDPRVVTRSVKRIRGRNFTFTNLKSKSSYKRTYIHKRINKIRYLK